MVYWMSRDQRMHENWALLFAREQAVAARQPLLVVFCLAPSYLGAAIRQYGFMLEGLKELENNLRGKNIPFFLLSGEPAVELPRFLVETGAGEVVGDFNPLRINRGWQRSVIERIDIPFHEVDAHNIVPAWVASGKQEYGAYTIRPKINRLLDEYLESFPALRRHTISWKGRKPRINWRRIEEGLTVSRSVPEAGWIAHGEREARFALRRFIRRGLGNYAINRNDPAAAGQSNLSPYLHFGQLSTQRVALKVMTAEAPFGSKEAFLEELIVRRELADNFCFYNSAYDSTGGFPEWARITLDEHRSDRRDHLYSLEEFEEARTHDELWNAAQAEMVSCGKMHGYMRMYWAKKILQWTESPEQAMEYAIYLNDRYELDGRDPSGYAGIAWAVGGVHDRAWAERPVFGKVRYMSYESTRRKFDAAAYVRRFLPETAGGRT